MTEYAVSGHAAVSWPAHEMVHSTGNIAKKPEQRKHSHCLKVLEMFY